MKEEVIFKSNTSITSIAKMLDIGYSVILDEDIGHVITRSDISLEKYYEDEYRVSMQSEDDDSLYAIDDGKMVFRTDKQLDLFISKVKPQTDAKILDFGCAKGLLSKKLATHYGIVPYLFDVTKGYVDVWDKYFSRDRYALYDFKSEWVDYFDIVMSFYVFEHLDDPIEALRKISVALKKDGLLYIQVPNMYAHYADFICIDHVQHYSVASIKAMFARAGFEIVEIDANSYDAAYVVVAKNSRKVSNMAVGEEAEFYNSKAREIANFWNISKLKITEFEKLHPNKHLAIYGAGFYSTFIRTCIRNQQDVVCHIDNNPNLIGTMFHDKIVISPDSIPNNIDAIYVGLNPLYAKGIVEKMPHLSKFDLFFL